MSYRTSKIRLSGRIPQRILSVLAALGSAPRGDLYMLVNGSSEQVRRILIRLEDEGVVIRVGEKGSHVCLNRNLDTWLMQNNLNLTTLAAQGVSWLSSFRRTE